MFRFTRRMCHSNKAAGVASEPAKSTCNPSNVSVMGVYTTMACLTGTVQVAQLLKNAGANNDFEFRKLARGQLDSDRVPEYGTGLMLSGFATGIMRPVTMPMICVNAYNGRSNPYKQK